ncbi:MAG: PglZ domain-containing protein, partial [Byssovorax sp.]
ALALVGARERSFWLDRDVGRKAQWEACRRMGELGLVASSVRSALATTGNEPEKWFEAYTAKDGWYRMDQAQRRLEAWVTNLDEEPEERPLGVVRRVHEDTCHAMAEGFTKALVKASWTVPGTLPQTRIYSEVVAERPRPVAYFLVDAMRFEMGVELSERLPKSAEVAVRAALGSLPSITPVGMAALQPGASASFSVVEQGGVLGALIDGVFLPGLPARKKLAAARIPGLVDLTLDELLSLQTSKLTKKLRGAQVVIVRSQEIDHAGEAGFAFQARQVMDTVIDNLARAIRKLAMNGIEHSVVSADHGHLFFASDRDESMRTDAPGGQQIELHRRCWIGRGGTTPPGCVRVAASALGYASDLDFVFPVGGGVFKAGGDLAFHHGGPSLQELVLPVVTVRLKVRESARPSAGPVTASGLPDEVTNRIFSVTLKLGQNLSLFASGMVVRPLLMSAGKQVGAVGVAVGAELDRATGCVTLQPDTPITVGFLLRDDSVASLRVVVQDPATDADLFRSPADIPVRLGM